MNLLFLKAKEKGKPIDDSISLLLGLPEPNINLRDSTILLLPFHIVEDIIHFIIKLYDLFKNVIPLMNNKIQVKL